MFTLYWMALEYHLGDTHHQEGWMVLARKLFDHHNPPVVLSSVIFCPSNSILVFWFKTSILC